MFKTVKHNYQELYLFWENNKAATQFSSPLTGHKLLMMEYQPAQHSNKTFGSINGRPLQVSHPDRTHKTH